ncbi:MAG: glycolate oxidase FAD binding subunit [Myxococcota bacterium]|jgi:glycolate oxidase FAD binding subunit
MKADTIARLRAALAPNEFEESSDLEVEGQKLVGVLVPQDTASLSRVLAQVSEQKLPIIVQGSGSKAGLGNLSDDAQLGLSTKQLSGVRCFEPDDGVVEASGGTPLSVIRKTVLAKGWELPIDGGGANATIGGAIATAAYGPRCLAFGPVRRNVLGAEIVHASGTMTKCGGRVVKNVTGYDLGKLYTGSLGTLGVIAGAWLRLHPKPRSIAVRVAEFSQTDEALARGLEVSRRSSSRACVLLSPDVARRASLHHSLAASWVLLAEFAGEESECNEDAAWMEKELGAECPEFPSGEAALQYIDEVRDILTEGVEQAGVRTRVAALPTKLLGAARPLVKTGASMIMDPGLGLAFAQKTGLAPGAETHRFLATAREVAEAAGGNMLIETLPREAKQGVDVYGVGLDGALEVMRRLKDEYDPDHLLNRGRFVGGI